ncbi:hypothetical protein MKW98_006678 [Papaver atlanticum]|uniref:Uncharacterized protein n=1 Tax=Papaver atlanticum TaxID=357466 RepID=A0AAD4T0L3_9MAGN|nr:hypothetical protein MKW98_006678 [Papaver atlanticum]
MLILEEEIVVWNEIRGFTIKSRDGDKIPRSSICILIYGFNSRDEPEITSIDLQEHGNWKRCSKSFRLIYMRFLIRFNGEWKKIEEKIGTNSTTKSFLVLLDASAPKVSQKVLIIHVNMVVHFRRLEKPNEDYFSTGTPGMLTYEFKYNSLRQMIFQIGSNVFIPSPPVSESGHTFTLARRTSQHSLERTDGIPVFLIFLYIITTVRKKA